MVYWFTGQPGAGKTVLAKELEYYLKEAYLEVYHIDGDDLRDLIKNKDYSREGRIKNIELAQSIAKYLVKKGNTVIVSVVAPYLGIREEFKQNSDIKVQEIYVKTSEVRGRESYHVADYQAPEHNYIEIDTTGKTVEESFKELLERL